MLAEAQVLLNLGPSHEQVQLSGGDFTWELGDSLLALSWPLSWPHATRVWFHRAYLWGYIKWQAISLHSPKRSVLRMRKMWRKSKSGRHSTDSWVAWEHSFVRSSSPELTRAQVNLLESQRVCTRSLEALASCCCCCCSMLLRLKRASYL